MESTRIAAARALAEERHRGQVDKAGQPYIGHPARVACRLSGEDEQVVGWLHDTVEDTGLSLAEVRARGVMVSVDRRYPHMTANVAAGIPSHSMMKNLSYSSSP